jgi:hypothetical protein
MIPKKISAKKKERTRFKAHAFFLKQKNKNKTLSETRT